MDRPFLWTRALEKAESGCRIAKGFEYEVR